MQSPCTSCCGLCPSWPDSHLHSKTPCSSCGTPPSPEARAETAADSCAHTNTVTAAWPTPLLDKTEWRGVTQVTYASVSLSAKPGWESGSKRFERVRNRSSARWVKTWRAPGASTESRQSTHLQQLDHRSSFTLPGQYFCSVSGPGCLSAARLHPSCHCLCPGENHCAERASRSQSGWQMECLSPG